MAEENFSVLFDEEQNFVEIQYQGVNATLLASLQASVTALQLQLQNALNGVNGTLNNLNTDIGGLSALIHAVGVDLSSESASRLATDGTLGNSIVANHQAAMDAIEQEAETRASALLAEAAARGAAIMDATATIVSDFGNLATSVNGLATQLGAAQASIIAVNDALSLESSARASQITAIQADLGENSAAILEESVARADEDSALASTISAVSAVANAATKTYFQTSAPSSGMTVGSLWFDSDDGNKAYRYNGTSWEEVLTGGGSGNVTYYQTTEPSSGMIAGDVWFDSDANNRMYRYNGTSWVAVDDGRIAANEAAVVAEAIARANGDSALASSISSVNTAVGVNTAAITAEATARSNADGALSTTVNNVSATANSKNRSWRQASAPTASAVGDLWFDSDDGNKAYRWDGSSWVATDDTRIASNVAAISSEATTRANADSALASSISTLTTTVGTNTSSISTQASAINGIQAKYSLTLDINGRISGIELIGTGAGSQFNILADSFKIFNGTTDIAPFTVSGGSVYMDNVIARNLSATSLSAVSSNTGALTVTGNLDISTSGTLRSGKTSYGSGTGYIFEYNGGTPRLDIGNSSNWLRWTGSALSVSGNINATNPSNSFVPTWSAVSTAPSAVIHYIDFGAYVIAWCTSSTNGTSSAGTFSIPLITNWPSAIYPSSRRSASCVIMIGSVPAMGAVQFTGVGTNVAIEATYVNTIGSPYIVPSAMPSSTSFGLGVGWMVIYTK